MTNIEIIEAAKKAVKCKTLYVMGGFGAPLNSTNKIRYTSNHAYNQQANRAVKIRAADDDAFGFDCVGFIKGLLWGWRGDTGHVYGGATYCTANVPDVGADQMITLCLDQRTDFSRLEPGEVCWMPGHVGLYIGDGLCAEASPAWTDGVQITACNKNVSGYNRRNWQKHGKMPWVTYIQQPAAAPGTGDPAACCTVELPVLRQGSKGDAVRAMQALLIYRGFRCGIWGTDGDFGGDTQNALLSFQERQGIREDGCGTETWGKLLGNST